jgi:2'-5' RNA ligase
MPYAIEVNFDRTSEQHLRDLIKSLADEHGAGVLTELDSRPHISLAVLDRVEPAALCDVVARSIGQICTIPVRLSATGAFPGPTGIVFVAPAASRALMEMHFHFYKALLAEGMTSQEHYSPDHWVPHCTVAIDLPNEEVPKIVDIVRQAPIYRQAYLESITVVEFRPVRELRSYALSPANPPVKLARQSVGVRSDSN